MSSAPDGTAARRELLRRRLAAAGLTQVRGGDTDVSGRISRRDPGDEQVLSFAQARMWFLHQLAPEDPAYNVCLTIRVRRPLDTAALRRAFHRLAQRHEVLRTRYEITDEGDPVQVIDPDPGFEFDTVRLDSATDDGQRCDELVRQHAAEPFDLGGGHPLRVRVLRRGARGDLLVLTVHHIVWDGATFGVLSAELSALYREATTGEPAGLAPLPVQYADVAVWQRRHWTPQRLAEQLDYWKSQLTPAPEALPLPTDAPRSPTPSPRGDRRIRTFAPEVSARLTELATTAGATPFMVLLAGFAALLSRYTGATDVPIGSPSMNRDAPELQGLIGNFVNTLVLRADVSGDPSFAELLERVRLLCADGYAHQDAPFDTVVDELRPPRRQGHSVFFDVMLVLVAQDLRGPRLPGVESWELVPNGTTQFDLALEALLIDGEVRIEATYRSELFRPGTVDRMLEHLEVLLAAGAADPHRPVRRLALLSTAEREQILQGFNHTTVAFRPATLTGLVEDQVSRTPDAVAVELGSTSVTYAALDARADRLARRLAGLGVGPECRVGIHLDRSVEMIVGLLAVLKAGGAFVPLEPGWPAGRIAEVCSGAGLAAVLTGSGTEELIAAHAGAVPVVVLGRGGGLPGGVEPRSAGLGVPVDPDGLAYVIYTSGSTGVPKGAMIRHQAIAHRLEWQRELLGFGPGDAALFKAPLGFDISINEIFLPLTTGARLVIAEPGGERDPEYLLDLLARHRVTFTYLVSSQLDLLLELDGAARGMAGLRHVWCGGEVLTPELFGRFRETCPAVMYHGYGPAEATIGVSHVVYRDTAIRSAVSIGEPNSNTRLYVLDPALAPVPVGVRGELYAGGVYLGRGYLNDPRRTAAHFVADPFGPPGARLYRTGDLARWCPDGTLEFLGRADNQVKVRGMRVELEEIDAVLEQHDRVRRAVVLLHTDSPGVQRLVGHLVLESTSDGTADASDDDETCAQVRAWLATRVPEHMVPSVFLVLAAFPLLPSGKVDRARLPAPPTDRDGAVEPANEHERAFCELFCQTLGLASVGAADNFFEIGGDSIQSIRLVNRARKAGLGITARDVFAQQTPARLAGVAQRVTAPADEPGTRRSRPLLELSQEDLDLLEDSQDDLEDDLEGDPEYSFEGDPDTCLDGVPAPVGTEELRRSR